MKTKGKLILGLVGASTLALGVGVALGVHSLVKDASLAQPVAAANMTASDTIYFDKAAYKADGTWANQTVYARYWTGSVNGFVACTKIADSDQVWYVNLNSVGMSSSGGFCIRAASSGSDDYKETKWISWSTWTSQANNVIKLSGSNDSSDSYRANYSTEYLAETSSAQGGAVAYNSLSSSAATERVWVRSSASWWYNDSTRTAIRTWTTVGSNTTVNIYKTTAIQNTDDNLYYWYADVPTSITGLQFVRLNALIDGVYNYSEAGDKAQTAAIAYLYTQDGHSNLSVSFAGVDNPNPTLCQAILAGFTTCSSSAVNGYGAFTGLNDNFISKLTSAEVTTFNSLAITDYSYSEYSGNSNSYTGLTKNTATTCQLKWAKMGSMSSGSSAFNVAGTSDTGSIALMSVIAVTGVAAAGAFFFFRKKHVA
jgi:hypothetical protein